MFHEVEIGTKSGITTCRRVVVSRSCQISALRSDFSHNKKVFQNFVIDRKFPAISSRINKRNYKTRKIGTYRNSLPFLFLSSRRNNRKKQCQSNSIS